MTGAPRATATGSPGQVSGSAVPLLDELLVVDELLLDELLGVDELLLAVVDELLLAVVDELLLAVVDEAPLVVAALLLACAPP